MAATRDSDSPRNIVSVGATGGIRLERDSVAGRSLWHIAGLGPEPRSPLQSTPRSSPLPAQRHDRTGL
jgi:hypothetical protein